MNLESLLQESRRRSLEQETRRQFITRCATGLGAVFLAGQNASSASGSSSGRSSSNPFGQIATHFPSRAKRVIYLHMIGAPSQLELFDYKPDLKRLDGQPCPQSFLEGKNFAFIQGTPNMLGPQFPFKQHGASGAWVSDRLPHFSKVVDDVSFIKTLQTDQFNHGPAQLLVHSGQPRIGYPSIGSWVTWGMGTENADLPGFVVLFSGGRIPVSYTHLTLPTILLV